jgi:hypothetical protein
MKLENTYEYYEQTIEVYKTNGRWRRYIYKIKGLGYSGFAFTKGRARKIAEGRILDWLYEQRARTNPGIPR